MALALINNVAIIRKGYGVRNISMFRFFATVDLHIEFSFFWRGRMDVNKATCLIVNKYLAT